MMKEKRRPTLDELKSLPKELWTLELAHITVDAQKAGQADIEREALETWLFDPDLTPEKIVALRERLQRATGSTTSIDVQPVPQPDAA